MKKKTSDLLKKLKAMHEQGGAALFERIGLAVEVWNDKDWLADAYEGNEAVALKAMRTEYFSDLGSMISMIDLINIRVAFPDKEVWKANKWNLRVMLALLREQQDSAKDKKTLDRKSWKEEAEKLVEENESLKKKIMELVATIKGLKEDKNDIASKLFEVVGERDQLIGRLAEREKIGVAVRAA